MYSEDAMACPDYVENWTNDPNATVKCGKAKFVYSQAHNGYNILIGPISGRISFFTNGEKGRK